MEQVNNLQQVIYLGAMVGALYIVISLSSRKKNGFLRQFSRGDFMRKLNKKMEREQEEERKNSSPK